MMDKKKRSLKKLTKGDPLAQSDVDYQDMDCEMEDTK